MLQIASLWVRFRSERKTKLIFKVYLIEIVKEQKNCCGILLVLFHSCKTFLTLRDLKSNRLKALVCSSQLGMMSSDIFTESLLFVRGRSWVIERGLAVKPPHQFPVKSALRLISHQFSHTGFQKILRSNHVTPYKLDPFRWVETLNLLWALVMFKVSENEEKIIA